MQKTHGKNIQCSPSHLRSSFKPANNFQEVIMWSVPILLTITAPVGNVPFSLCTCIDECNARQVSQFLK